MSMRGVTVPPLFVAAVADHLWGLILGDTDISNLETEFFPTTWVFLYDPR